MLRVPRRYVPGGFKTRSDVKHAIQITRILTFVAKDLALKTVCTVLIRNQVPPVGMCCFSCGLPGQSLPCLPAY